MGALDGKVALITGASKGIGAAMARGLAVYLASDASAYCSGGIYMVDGGYSAS